MKKNAAAVFCTNSHCIDEVVGHVKQKMFMIVSMFLSLPHCTLDIFAPVKGVNCGSEYGLEVPEKFHFYGPEKTINLDKNKRYTNSLQLLYSLLFGVSTTERSVLGNNLS